MGQFHFSVRQISVAFVLLLTTVTAQAQTTAAGFIPGSFGVGPSGAATYTIPIQVPPGVAGMEPKLALSYNSQAGNGLLGVGWNLEGLSSISRCPRTMAQDGVRGALNFDNNDRYCLDGQRLIAINGTYGADGTEYRTEREAFAKIVSYGTAGNGPAWFKVWTKSGQIMEYGNTADSRIEAVKPPNGGSWPTGTVKDWAQNKISDTNGNYYALVYTEDATNGAYFIQRIDYSGSVNGGLPPSHSARFEYTPSRPDSIDGYFAGAKISSKRLINSIKTFSDGVLNANLNLIYSKSLKSKRSVLQHLELCDASGACKLKTVLQKNDSGTLLSPSAPIASAGSGFDQNWSSQFADANRDGIPDVVRVRNTGDIAVAFGLGDGSFESTYKTTAISGYNVGGCEGCDWERFVLDVNGDGIADCVRVRATGDIHVHLGIGNGYFHTNAVGTGSSDMGSMWRRFISDANGDGIPDIVRVRNTGDIAVWLGLGNGAFNPAYKVTSISGYNVGGCLGCDWERIVVDVNGDGLADVIRARDTGDINVFLGKGDGEFSTNAIGVGASQFGPSWGRFMADANGDGALDIVRIRDTGDVAVWLGRGNGTFDPSYKATGISGYNVGGCVGCDWERFVIDMNGDGIADIVRVRDTGDINVFLGKGDGFFLTSAIGHGAAQYGASWFRHIDDVNGSGLPSVVRIRDSGEVAVFLAAGAYLDTVTTINHGYGAQTQISYKGFSDPLVHVSDTGNTWPIRDLTAVPIYMVKSAIQSNGINGALTTSFKYGGLKAEVGTGRGLLGFRWMEIKDEQTGIVNRTEYRQDFPYTGLPSKAEVRKADGSLLKQVNSTYDCTDFVSSSGCIVVAGRRYFPFAQAVIEQSWDLNGAALPTVTTNYQYDAWGNATQVQVGTGDGYSKTTTNTYVNDSSKWFLGRLQRSSVTSTTP